MAETSLTIVAESAWALTTTADVLVLLEPESDSLSRQATVLDERLGGRLARARQFKELTGRPNETTMLHMDATIASSRVLVVGVGREDSLTIERVCRAAGTAVRQLRRREVARATLVLPESVSDNGD
ncbi:MAG: hypothetical protein FJ033_10125 [Chloroflexi bacterium]|nr:hypothetical protein [Chloroflexota bacterium]